MPHHFISYSKADAKDFSLRLTNALIKGPPEFAIWFDKQKLVAGRD